MAAYQSRRVFDHLGQYDADRLRRQPDLLYKFDRFDQFDRFDRFALARACPLSRRARPSGD